MTLVSGEPTLGPQLARCTPLHRISNTFHIILGGLRLAKTYSPAKALGMKRATAASRTAVGWNMAKVVKSNKREMLLIAVFSLTLQYKNQEMVLGLSLYM